MIDEEIVELSVRKEGDIYKYFLGDKAIGAYDPDIMGDNLIAFRENSLENELSENIRDEIVQMIENAGKDEITKVVEEKEENKEENVYDKVEGYEEEIGSENEDLEPEILEEKSAIVEKDKKVQKEDRQEEEEEKPEKIENTTGAIPIKQEVDMDTMVTDLDSLGEKLEKAGKIKGADEKNGKLGIVESSDLKNLRDENGKQLEGHSSRYEAVVITDKTGKDGKPIVRALDLETDSQEGTNPVGKNYQVKQNKDIEKEDVQTRLEVQGDETIGIKEGKYGEKEIYYSKNKTLGGEGVEGNRSLDIQLETEESKNSIGGTDQEIQKLSQEYQDGYRSVEDSYQEAKIHENSQGEPCEELEPEDIDGDPNTSTHNHIDETVDQLMKNEKINNKFTEREVREMVERAWDKKDNEETLEEFKERIEDTVELDAENMRGERGI